MSEKIILVWFRNDLRVHDNEILLEAVRKADKVLPVYCFDPFYFTTTPAGTLKTGSIRAKFLLESVADLRRNLQLLGGELLVRMGHPAEVLPQLVTEYKVTEVYHHREVAFEETAISEAVEAALWKLKINLKHFIGHTLYHKEDLPFPIKDIPDSFATFRKKVERDSAVRSCIATPERIHVPEINEPGGLPALKDLGLPEPAVDERGYVFSGGETAGLEQLNTYFTQSLSLNTKARQSAQASRLSPWLALGCLSMRQAYAAAFKHQQDQGGQLLLADLLWRDYYRFMFKKHGSQKFYRPEGFKGEAPAQAAGQQELWLKWQTGTTGEPFVDAAMHELNATGYLSSMARQIVAAYLVKELKADWTLGAAWFEEKLIDYSPASNWGNWASVAGVGNDARENRKFDLGKLIQNLDPKGEYGKLWAGTAARSAALQGIS